MAGYVSHLFCGCAVGVAIVATEITHSIDTAGSIMVVFLGAVGGVLPDLDSDTSRPYRTVKHMVSLIFSLALAVLLFSLSRSTLIAFFGFLAVFIFTELGIFGLIQRLTKHRGTMHSIPFAILTGILTALCLTFAGQPNAKIGGLALTCGALSHLVLDEFNSIGLHNGIVPRLKNSFGSALKFGASSKAFTITIYLLIVLASISMML